MDEITKKYLRIAKIIQTFLLISIAVYACILYVYKNIIGMGQILDSYTLNIISCVLAIMTIIAVFLSYYTPRKYFNSLKATTIQNIPKQYNFFSIQVIQCFFLLAVAVYGLILGLLGAEWMIVIPFWVVAAATLIHTFPTEKKWRKVLAKLNPNDYEYLYK